jgi:chaperone BCS1
MAAASLNTTNVANFAASLLETTIPGFSVVSRAISEYFGIDISLYIGYAVTMMGIWTAANYLWGIFYNYFTEWFMSTAEVRYNDEMYNYLMYFIANHNLSKRATNFIAGTKTGREWDCESDDENEAEINDDDDLTEEKLKTLRLTARAKPLRFTPARGSTHWFLYKGVPLRFQRQQERQGDGGGGYWSGTREEVYVSCFGRDTRVLKSMLLEAQRMYLERDSSKTVIYRATKGSSDDMDWTRTMARPPRPMETVVLDKEQKDLILDDMKEYLHPRTKKWYSNRGIPYRRGYLLHGPPGTGKSSLCFALAGVLHLPIYVANLNAKSMTEDTLANLFRDLPARSIVLLEDIDSAGLKVDKRGDKGSGASQTVVVDEDDDGFQPKPLRRSTTGVSISVGKDKKDEVVNKGISFSGFLNIIDGVASAEGRILIMTTNHVEILDPALLRPGRCDLKVHFSNASRDVIKGLFLAIYSAKDIRKKPSKKGAEKVVVEKLMINKHGLTEEQIKALAEEFAAKLPEDELSPAEIQGYLLKNKMDPQNAVKGIEEWLSERALQSSLRS